MKKKTFKGYIIALLFFVGAAFVLSPSFSVNATSGLDALKEEAEKKAVEKASEQEEFLKNNVPNYDVLKEEAEKKASEKASEQEVTGPGIDNIKEEIPQKDSLPSEEPDSGSKEKAKESLVEDVSGELQLSDEDKKRAAELVTKYLNGDSVELTEEDRAKLQVYMQGAKEKQVIEQLLADKTMLPPNTGDSGYTEVWNASVNPWDIISGRQGVGSGIYSLGGDTFAQRLFRLLRTTLVVVCLIGTMCSLITIPFISSSAQLRERKEELTHKAIIFALSFAIIPILNFLRLLMDYQFGIR